MFIDWSNNQNNISFTKKNKTSYCSKIPSNYFFSRQFINIHYNINMLVRHTVSINQQKHNYNTRNKIEN